MTTPPLLDLFKTSKPYPALAFGALESRGDRIGPFGHFIIEPGEAEVSASLRDVIELWEPLVQYEEPAEELEVSAQMRDTLELYSILIQHDVDDPGLVEVDYLLRDVITLPTVLVTHTQYDIDMVEVEAELLDVITFD